MFDYRPWSASHDVPCLLCETDYAPIPVGMSRATLEWADARTSAHVFAIECGGSPEQLDHYAWVHMSPGNETDYQEASNG
jgi:hypothetical protein